MCDPCCPVAIEVTLPSAATTATAAPEVNEAAAPEAAEAPAKPARGRHVTRLRPERFASERPVEPPAGRFIACAIAVVLIAGAAAGLAGWWARGVATRPAGAPKPGDVVARTAQLWPHRHGTDAMFLALLRAPGA